MTPSETQSSLSIVRIYAAGIVDDGKSTLIGRLLHDTGNLPDDQIRILHASSSKQQFEGPHPFALVTDGLRAEEEQGITIDVAYRYFSRNGRRFILADAPGYEQYTRNLATAASSANVSLILVDARKGLLPQTRRHTFIASLMGVPRVVLLINKMDLVGHSQNIFDDILRDFLKFTSRLEFSDVRAIPISAAFGDNVTSSSSSMGWYTGPSLLEYLDAVYVAGDENRIDFRFPIQMVIRENGFRG